MNAFSLVLNSLWQAAAVAALVWFVLRLLPRINAATCYVAWWAALAVVLMLPLAPAMLPRSPTAPVALRSAHAAPPNPLLPAIEAPAIVMLHPKPSAKWPLAIVALWSVVFLYGLTRIARSYLWLRRVKAGATASPEPLPITGRNAGLLLSRDISSPMAVGFFKPAVILPESLPSELDSAEFDDVMLHEAAHLARFDDWMNLVARLLGAALALHPVALWILRQIEREREIACDDWVVARTGKARKYAASLARMYELRWSERNLPREDVLASGIFGRGSRTAQRIELLLRKGRDFSPGVSLSRVALSTTALLALAAATSRAPHWIAFAQQTPRPSFEVASVKPGNPSGGRFGYGFRGAEFVADNVPLKILIGFAYDVQFHQLFGGPKWIDTDRFSIEAKPGGTAPATPENTPRIRLMVQSLLEQRFKLALHRDTRMQMVYELSVAKGGPKVKTSAGPGADRPQGIWNRGRGEMVATNIPVSTLVDVLSQRLGATVIDKTGLAGKYDFTLSFMPEPTQADLALFGPPPEANPPADGSLPSVFTALQEQLGLRLESARGPVDVLVIDRAERPDAN